MHPLTMHRAVVQQFFQAFLQDEIRSRRHDTALRGSRTAETSCAVCVTKKEKNNTGYTQSNTSTKHERQKKSIQYSRRVDEMAYTYIHRAAGVKG